MCHLRIVSLRNLYRRPGGSGFGLIDLDGLLLAPSPRRFAAAAELARLVSDAFRRFPGTPDRERWIAETLAAYREAVREKYRFFSFGDAMLIL